MDERQDRELARWDHYERKIRAALDAFRVETGLVVTSLDVKPPTPKRGHRIIGVNFRRTEAEAPG